MTAPGWLRVCIALFAVAWGGNQFTPLLVLYRLHDSLTAQAVDILLAAYVIGIVPALLIGGPASDRIGRRPFVRLAPLLAVAGSLVLAVGAATPGLLFAGRVVSGVALGLGLAVGSSWVKELTARTDDHTAAGSGLGARRASLALTAGFGVGAVAAATLAQFAPQPTIVPYAVNIVIDLIACALVWQVDETGSSDFGRARSHRVTIDRRFLGIVAPMAPWVFGTATTAYAVLPGIFGSRYVGFEVGFSGLVCFVALGSAFVTQPLARRFDRPGSARSVILGMATGAVGLAVAALAAALGDVAVAFVSAALLGSSYGVLMLAGLLQVQRIASADDLAGLTGVYYSLTYLGFFVPAALAALHSVLSYSELLAIGCILAVAAIGVISTRARSTAPVPLGE